MRPAAKPLTLSPESTGTPLGYKLAFGALIAAGAFFFWRKRTANGAGSFASLASAFSTRSQKSEAPSQTLRVLAKTSAGMRSDLLVVDVGSMRVLVGVTPSSIQTLAILPDESTNTLMVADPAMAPALSPAAAAYAASASAAPSAAPDASRHDEEARIARRSLLSDLIRSTHPDDAATIPPPPKVPHLSSNRPKTNDREAVVEGQARGIVLALNARSNQASGDR